MRFFQAEKTTRSRRKADGEAQKKRRMRGETGSQSRLLSPFTVRRQAVYLFVPLRSCAFHGP